MRQASLALTQHSDLMSRVFPLKSMTASLPTQRSNYCLAHKSKMQHIHCDSGKGPIWHLRSTKFRCVCCVCVCVCVCAHARVSVCVCVADVQVPVLSQPCICCRPAAHGGRRRHGDDARDAASQRARLGTRAAQRRLPQVQHGCACVVSAHATAIPCFTCEECCLSVQRASGQKGC